MIKSAAGKALGLGRATVLPVVLAVMLVVVFGATPASAHKGYKGLFHLGHKSAIAKATKLVGKVATGSSLVVKNPSGGSALGLQVNAGQAPLTVNADAGKATNLNADRLDGKNDTDFYAAGSKVADSDKLDNKDSTAFLGKTEKATDADKLDGKEASEFASAYKRTVVVSPTGTDAQNGTALLDALSGITDASASKPYLLYIEAGTYDLGTGSLGMKQHVDIQGAGELKTVITSTVSNCISGTVRGANNAELRFLTVRNTGTGFCAIGIGNYSASPLLTHVRAESTGGGGTHHPGVYNDSSNPTMTNVTAAASGGSSNYGVLNDSSNPTMTNVTAAASGGTNNYGVFNFSSSPLIRHSRLSGNTNSLFQQNGGPAKVAITQLVGPIGTQSGTLQCFDNYDDSLAPVSCP